jgi:GT2 family glycosyltransferase
MYFEETDWCYRMKQAGGEVWYCPSGSIVHLGGGEFGHYDERRLIHFHHSLLTFYQKHHSRTEGIALRGILFLRVLIRLVVWLAVAAVMPRRHASAWSSVRGYARTLGLLVGMEVRVA